MIKERTKGVRCGVRHSSEIVKSIRNRKIFKIDNGKNINNYKGEKIEILYDMLKNVPIQKIV